MRKTNKNLLLRLRGKAVVYIDWANVYGWRKSLKKEVDLKKLYRYLKSYKQVKEIKIYFGTDKNKKSKEFLDKARNIGYRVSTKPVKYILIAKIEEQKLFRRKCDFDMEMCIDVHKTLEENFDSFIFFTGDGDFEPLYKLLIFKRKQVIVIYAHGHLGREIYGIARGIYKKSVDTIEKVF